MLLGDLFDLSLKNRRHDSGLITDGPDGPREWTFGEIHDHAARIAHALALRGLRPGDRLVVHLVNGTPFLELFIASVKSGLVFVPVNILYREREIAHIVGDADPALIITSSSSVPLFPEATPVLDVDDLLREAAALEPVDVRPALDGDAPVAIVYTSGTTGRSKGAVLSHNSFLANTAALVSCWSITSTDRYLAALPLFHVHGLGNGVCSWLATGCRMRLVERFDASRVAQWFESFRPTLFFGVPTMYVRLLELPDDVARAIGKGMRLFVSGSAPLPGHVLDAFRERFGHTILERYGMSETLMLTSNLLAGERRAGTVGYPLPGVSVSLRDSSGKPMPPDMVGDVWVRGPAVFSGYWRNPDATTAAFRDGWFVTGDVGQMDRDGCLTLRGRSTELIISGGFNIYPREIEEVLLELDGVREAAVIGAPDERRGEVPVAYVVADAGVDLEDVRERCARHLASFKAPRAVIRVDTLPRNALGKLQKHLLPAPTA